MKAGDTVWVKSVRALRESGEQIEEDSNGWDMFGNLATIASCQHGGFHLKQDEDECTWPEHYLSPLYKLDLPEDVVTDPEEEECECKSLQLFYDALDAARQVVVYSELLTCPKQVRDLKYALRVLDEHLSNEYEEGPDNQ